MLLASRHLRESHQLHSFLEFVVRETLSGRQDGLKEYLLGSQVFGRRQDYDPRPQYEFRGSGSDALFLTTGRSAHSRAGSIWAPN